MNLPDDFIVIAHKKLKKDPETRDEYLSVMKEWLDQQPELLEKLETELPEELMAIIRKELNSDPETREQYLMALKNWLNQQPHFVEKVDEVILMATLLGTKYNIKRAKKKLNGLYTYRTLHPKLFSNRDPFRAEIQAIHDMSIQALVKPKTTLERWVLARRFHPDESSKTTPESLLKAVSMMFEIAIKEHPEMLVLGFEFVAWGDDFNSSHAMMWSPAMLNKLLKFLQDCCPLGLRSVVLINAPKPLAGLAQVFKTLVKAKLKNRIHIYKAGSAKLEQYNDRIPEEFGGTNGKMQDHVDFWKTKLENCKDWFEEQEKYKSDESLRPKNSSKDLDKDV